MKVKSKKPRKQRNALLKVKNHQVSKLFTVPLEDNLQEEWGIKRLPLRVDDYCRITSGEFSGIEGKILSVDKKTRKVTIEETSQEKKDGSSFFTPIAPSKIILTKFATKKNKIDPWREKMIERKQKLEEIGEVSPKKTGGKK
ncbi:MAG: 50S ribosomal protein L24 [Promethearchaeota archaeon]